MSKKLVLVCTALAAVAAFALPVAASAKPALCETTAGVCVDTEALIGKKIHAHNVGAWKIVSGGTTVLECSTATWTGTVTKNSGGTFAIDIEKYSVTGHEAEEKCSSNIGAIAFDTNIGNGLPWCLHAEGTEDKYTVRGGSCTQEARSITFVMTTPIGTCKYSRATAFSGTFTTHTSPSEDAILTTKPSTATEITKEEGSVLCPASGQLEMSFTLTTDDEPTFTTLYIENI